MQYQDQNNEIIFTQEFFAENEGVKTYFDPDDNLLSAELQTPYQSKIDDCIVTRREQGIYDVKVFFPKNQSGVILYLTWLQEGLRKAIGYNIKTVYATGNFEITPQNVSELQLSQHTHANYEILQGFTDVDGVLHYEGVPVGGDITGNIINDAEISSNETWSSEKISQELNNIELTPGADGQDGAPGPNQVTTDTDTNITGLIKGAAGKVAQATAGTDYAAPDHEHEDYEPANSNIQSHISDTSNPHSVDKNDVGLGEVQNINWCDYVSMSVNSITITDDHKGKTIWTTSASAVSAAVASDLGLDFVCGVIQGGAGQVTFSGLGDVTIENQNNHTKTAGLRAAATLRILPDGTCKLIGETA